MRSQRALRLEEREIEGLWRLVPKEHRQRAEALLGKVVAQAAREELKAKTAQKLEEHDEPGIE